MNNEEILHYLLDEIGKMHYTCIFRFVYAKPLFMNPNNAVYLLEAGGDNSWVEIAEIPKVVFDELHQSDNLRDYEDRMGYRFYQGDSMSSDEMYNLIYRKTRDGIIGDILDQLEQGL